MPGVTHHLILVTTDGGIATHGYPEHSDIYDTISDVISPWAYSPTSTGRVMRRCGHSVRYFRYAMDEAYMTRPCNILSETSGFQFLGPVIVVGYPYGLDGRSTMVIVDDLLERYQICHMIPWPGREPDEKTVKDSP